MNQKVMLQDCDRPRAFGRRTGAVANKRPNMAIWTYDRYGKTGNLASLGLGQRAFQERNHIIVDAGGAVRTKRL
jgi:hypothetical protein